MFPLRFGAKVSVGLPKESKFPYGLVKSVREMSLYFLGLNKGESISFN